VIFVLFVPFTKQAIHYLVPLPHSIIGKKLNNLSVFLIFSEKARDGCARPLLKAARTMPSGVNGAGISLNGDCRRPGLFGKIPLLPPPGPLFSPGGLLRWHNIEVMVKNKLSVFLDAQVFALRPFSTSRDALAFQFVGVC